MPGHGLKPMIRKARENNNYASRGTKTWAIFTTIACH
jgi:hypothetical protein